MLFQEDCQRQQLRNAPVPSAEDRHPVLERLHGPELRRLGYTFLQRNEVLLPQHHKGFAQAIPTLPYAQDDILAICTAEPQGVSIHPFDTLPTTGENDPVPVVVRSRSL
jgi:hypothetical protein